MTSPCSPLKSNDIVLAYDIAPDGQRFLLPKAGGSQSDGDDAFNGMILVQNWFDELQRLVSTLVESSF